MAKQPIQNKKPQSVQVKPIEKKQRGCWLLALKFMLLFSMVTAVIVYTDTKGYFEPDRSNDHTSRKWNAFYSFTDNDTVDLVLVGNSHCYAGVNPKNLSEAIGANCFVLASPGTTIMDSYYCLEEALERTQPKVAIIETYGISNSVNHRLNLGSLSDQFKSYNARKNVKLKLASMPTLFSVENYAPAWSASIRNHDFIFHNREQIERNTKLNHQRASKKDKKLYLGRFVSFTTGIEDSTMMKYDSLGAPVDGTLREVNEENALFVNKIVELCKQHNVTPVFVTIPMYYRHIENYGAWKNTIASVIEPTEVAWLNLQEPYDTIVFDKDCFENTYAQNQHMTFEGSVRSAYKIAHFMVDSLKIEFPRRNATKHWHDMFYGEEGYFANYPSHEDDTINVLICKDLVLDSIEIKDCLMLRGETTNIVFLKIAKKDGKPMKNQLRFIVEVKYEGEKMLAYLDCWQQNTFDPLTHDLYICPMKEGVELLGIKQWLPSLQ